MAEALRNLQIFRNGTLMTGTAYEVKAAIAGLISNSQLELHDGEPISVRYQEVLNGEVKGLYGVAYGSGTTATVLWGGSGENVSIVTEPLTDDYVTLTYTLGTQNDYTLTAEANVVNLDAAEVGTTGLADALDVKEHIKYYDVVAGDNIVEISTAGSTDANGFSTTTFTVSISTENLPSAPEYTIGTTTTSQGALKTYALFKDGDEVADSTIDIPQPTEYTAGNAIDINNNVVSVRLSTDNGNQIYFSQTDGGLFVPAGDTIVGVESVDLTQAQSPVTYGVVNGHTVVLTKQGDNWYYDNEGVQTLYTGERHQADEGHKYLVVITSGGHQYWVNNDSSDDIHVSGFAVGTNQSDEEVLRITMNNNTTYEVLISDIAPEIPAATVNWVRDNNNDELNIGTEGILTQLALGTIEAYIDNFDCGTF